MLVTVVVGDEGLVITGPEGTGARKDHTPVPEVGAVALMVALATPQTVTSGPALAVEGAAIRDMVRLALESVQGALEMVHLTTVDAPSVNPVTEELGLLGEEMTPLPDTTVQVPVPLTGMAPETVVELLHTV